MKLDETIDNGIMIDKSATIVGTHELWFRYGVRSNLFVSIDHKGWEV